MPAADAGLAGRLERALALIAPQHETRTVTRQQALAVLHLAGLNPSKQEMRAYCKTRTEISIEELPKLAASIHTFDPRELVAAFHVMDEDGDGHLSPSELRNALMKRGERMTSAEVEAALAQFDADGDGKISGDEFAELIGHCLTESRRICAAPAVRKPSVRKPSVKAAAQAQDRSPAAVRKAPSAKRRATKREPSRRGSSRKGTASPDPPDVTASPPTRPAQPHDKPVSCRPKRLKSWPEQKLRGTFTVTDADHGFVFSEQYSFAVKEETEVYIELDVRRAESASREVDVGLILLTADQHGLHHVASYDADTSGNPEIKATVGPGMYTVLPFCPGCKLRKRDADPPETAALFEEDGETFTRGARRALEDVFYRIDVNGGETLGRLEYDLMLFRTDGVTVDDESWEVFSADLSMTGFMGFMEQALQQGEDAAWSVFESLGYNRQLQLDQGCAFELRLHAAPPKGEAALGILRPDHFDDLRLQRGLGLMLSARGENRQELRTGISLLVLASESWACIGFNNQTEDKVVATVDWDGSVNTVASWTQGTTRTVEVPPQTCVPVVQLMQDDESEAWSYQLLPNIT